MRGGVAWLFLPPPPCRCWPTVPRVWARPETGDPGDDMVRSSIGISVVESVDAIESKLIDIDPDAISTMPLTKLEWRPAASSSVDAMSMFPTS